jgi:hypothetical protein
LSAWRFADGDLRAHRAASPSDVPTEDEPAGRLERQHACPLALAAVDTPIEDAPAGARLEDGLLDVDGQHVVLARLDPVEVVDEDAERALERGLDHDRELDRGAVGMDAVGIRIFVRT